ncbi:hypothetical protein L6164_020577 [Bauhinia variegata]|nr:hypothetical protein L6164_020577 [Bauhinia variegata]
MEIKIAIKAFSSSKWQKLRSRIRIREEALATAKANRQVTERQWTPLGALTVGYVFLLPSILVPSCIRFRM